METEVQGEKERGGRECEDEDEDDAPLGHDNRNIPPYIQLSSRICSRYLHVRELQSLLQRTTEHRSRRWRHVFLHESHLSLSLSLSVPVGQGRARFLRRSDMLPPRAQPWFSAAIAGMMIAGVVVLVSVLMFVGHET